MGINSQSSVPTFTAGQVLTAQQQNWINTGVPVFDNTTQRDSAFGGTGEKTLAEGQLCYLEDTNVVQFYTGTAWQTLAPVITAIGADVIATSQSTTSTAYTDLATVGPTVTITTGTTALVIVSCVHTAFNTNPSTSYMGFAVSGATTIAAADASAKGFQNAGGAATTAAVFRVTTLNAGSNTFTAKYRLTAGSGAFEGRLLQVIALP